MNIAHCLRRGFLSAIGLSLCTGTLVAVHRFGLESRSAPPSPAIVGDSPGVRAEGRRVAYPGADVTVGTERGGRILRLAVRERDSVRAGDVLAELDADEPRAALAEARARVEEAEADVRYLESQRARAKELWTARAGSREAVDLAERDLEAATARRASSQASVTRLEAALAKTRILAPIDGIVTARYADAGETIEPLAPIVTLVDLSKTRIEAEVDEFDAGRVRAGSEVTITAEGYEGQSWKGVVEEVPDVVVARRLHPEDPARPTDTRVLRVGIAVREPTPIKLGQRVEVVIH